MKKVIILFGEMGVGKNFVGSILASHLGLPFVDGDEMLPNDLAEKVENMSPLLKPEIDRFVMNHLIPKTIRLARNSDGRGFVLAQALYLKEHRAELGRALKSAGIDFQYVYVKVNSLRDHVSRLFSRRKGFRWVIYGMMNKPFFQKPDGDILVFDNCGNEAETKDRLSYLPFGIKPIL